MKRIISLIICSVMVISGALVFAPEIVSADTDLSLTASKEVHYLTGDYEPIFYDEGLLMEDGRVFNIHMSNMSFEAIQTQERNGIRCKSIFDYLEDNGFSDIEANDDAMKETYEEGLGLVCARKTIKDDGKDYTLITLFPIGGTYGKEWDQILRTNDHINDKGSFAGVDLGRKKAVKFLKEYIGKNEIKGDIKLWMTGFSRTASVMNLTAAEIIKYPNLSLGTSVKLSPENIYCYLLGTITPAAIKDVEEDYSSGKYDFSCIHNVCDNDDAVMHLPTSGFKMSRYGDFVQMSLPEYKDRMLEVMKTMNEERYQEFMERQDPEGFTPFKIIRDDQTESFSLISVEDEDSYLPKDMLGYIESFMENVDTVLARASSKGDDSREGYASAYQTGMRKLITYFAEDNHFSFRYFEMSSTVPMVVSMYITFIVDKIVYESEVDLNGTVEKAFNALAFLIENSDGTVKDRYSGIADLYNELTSNAFVLSPDYSEADREGADLENPPHKYDLNVDLGDDPSLVVELLRKITGKLYSNALEDILKNSGADDETIEQLTGDNEECENMAYLMSLILLGNPLQEKVSMKDFRLDNQYFKQLVTFTGNLDRFFAYHRSTIVVNWLRAEDPYYDNYQKADEAQRAGYRRVYISKPSGADVSGTVKDASGNTVAAFRNGELVSRTDEWIGATSCDTGGWLRIPLDKDYKIQIRVSKNTKLALRVADYSVDEGMILRNVTGDEKYDWTALAPKAGDALTLDIPAAEKTAEGYDITSAAYTLGIDESADPQPSPSSDDSKIIVKYSKKVPAASGVKAKAARRSFTVKWKKLSSSKKKKVGKVEIQYSKSKKFADGKTVTKEKAKTKTSLKVKKLKKGSVYYVRVRNVKYSGNIKYVSKWSKAKKIKVK